MPHIIRDDHGHEVQVLTKDDLTNATNRLLKWLLTTGILIVVTGTVMWTRLDARVSANERVVARREADQLEISNLTRKVDSLTYVMGTQTEILREIQRRMSR